MRKILNIIRFDGGLFKTVSEQIGTATERECRAVMNSLSEKHRHMTVGRKVFIHTDHQALAYYSENRTLTPKVLRWRERVLAELDVEIQYRPGSGMMADGLTRLESKQGDGRCEGTLLGPRYFSQEAWEDIVRKRQAEAA
jgi:hypothetical protein